MIPTHLYWVLWNFVPNLTNFRPALSSMSTDCGIFKNIIWSIFFDDYSLFGMWYCILWYIGVSVYVFFSSTLKMKISGSSKMLPFISDATRCHVTFQSVLSFYVLTVVLMKIQLFWNLRFVEWQIVVDVWRSVMPPSLGSSSQKRYILYIMVL
jgi:hypothetical protein